MLGLPVIGIALNDRMRATDQERRSADPTFSAKAQCYAFFKLTPCLDLIISSRCDDVRLDKPSTWRFSFTFYDQLRAAGNARHYIPFWQHGHPLLPEFM